MSSRFLAVCGLLLGLVIAQGCSESEPAPDAASATGGGAELVAFNPSAPAITLSVPGMTCGHCSQVVEDTLQALPGVAAVETDIENKVARVNVDADKFDADSAIAKLAEEGYPETTVAETTN